MAKYIFKNAKFVTTATKPGDYPSLKDIHGKPLPEIAVAGRSNVGKSSLLNHLFNSNKLVKTSATPGKTQALNFFSLNDALAFVDLPGYGYAQVPFSIRKQWGPMIQTYLNTSKMLKVILFLFDIRRKPNDDDVKFLEWAAASQKAVILVLTKVDKVKGNEKQLNTKNILNAFGADNLHYTHYSTTKDIGRKELIAMLCDAIQDEQNDDLG